MTRASIRDKLKKSASGAEFITKGDVKRCMGRGSDRVASTVKGLDFVRQEELDSMTLTKYRRESTSK